MMKTFPPTWNDFDVLEENLNKLRGELQDLRKKDIMLPVKHPQEGPMSDAYKNRIGNVPRPFCLPVKLLTNDGYHVADVEMPPFQTPPEVIIWGDRVFVPTPEEFPFKHNSGGPEAIHYNGKKPRFYCEAFAWAVPPDCVSPS